MEAAMRNFSREGHRFIFSANIFRLIFLLQRRDRHLGRAAARGEWGSISSNSKLSKGESNINSYV